MRIIYLIPSIFHAMFAGDERLKWYGAFCACTLMAVSMLFFLSLVIMELYFAVYLRKRFPDEWAAYKKCQSELTTYGHYRKWVIANHQEASPFYRLWNRQRQFGQVCLWVWISVIAISGLLALASWLGLSIFV
jgi:hypothetical protein